MQRKKSASASASSRANTPAGLSQASPSRPWMLRRKAPKSTFNVQDLLEEDPSDAGKPTRPASAAAATSQRTRIEAPQLLSRPGAIDIDSLLATAAAGKRAFSAEELGREPSQPTTEAPAKSGDLILDKTWRPCKSSISHSTHPPTTVRGF